METVEELQRKLGTAEDLQSVVKTMKALAAVSIRQFEQSVHALSEYSMTIELGLRAVLQMHKGAESLIRKAPRKKFGIVLFGSDQGMCGQLNDQTAAYAFSALDEMEVPRDQRCFIAVGLRAATQIELAGETLEKVLAVPSSAQGIRRSVLDLQRRLMAWQEQEEMNHILLIHSRPLSGASFQPVMVPLLPLDAEWLQRIQKQPWPTKQLPLATMDHDELFSSLVREYLFVSIYRAFAESLASENASRLASMQAAEKTIAERLKELTSLYHQQRQMTITSELLDIVAGFEALTTRKQ